MEIEKTISPNFRWHITNHTAWWDYVEKTWFNRWKWWISTKLFLPGTYEWIDDTPPAHGLGSEK
jgi:hypothetical protein